MIQEQSMSTALPKILVVEAEQSALLDLEQSLAKLGYQVSWVAGTGPEAVRLAGHMFPDVVLMSLRLGDGMEGIETAGEIRRRWQIPVIYTAAYADDELFERAKLEAPFGLLVKPFRAQELHTTISMALQQRRLSEEAFETWNWLGAILKSTRDGIIATDAAGQVRFMSSAAEEITGWSQSEALGKPIESVYPLLEIDQQPVRPHLLRRALDSGVTQEKARLVLTRRDGREIHIQDEAAPIRNIWGEISGALTVFCDMTERMQVEEFQRRERERLQEQVELTAEALGTTRTDFRALISRAITVEEEGRRRLARELHDDLGQRVAFLQFEAERMRKYAQAPEVQTGLQRVIDEAAKFSADLRALSHRLHPSLLEDLGLGAALRSLVEDYRRQGVDVTLSAGELSGPASPDVGTSLYRIAQEALRNAWKHAPGSAVYMRLLEDRNELQLMIEDTGPGFDLNKARADGGLGLLSMQERARLVGGSLLLSSQPDGGTTLLVRVPMSARA